jgi:hypothetical protein
MNLFGTGVKETDGSHGYSQPPKNFQAYIICAAACHPQIMMVVALFILANELDVAPLASERIQ